MLNESTMMFSQYDTILMTDIWEAADEFVYDYKHVGIPTTISDANATTLFYLLYSKYGNNPIINYDITQFKYKIFSVIFQYGPTWEKKLSIQDTLRSLDINELIGDGSIDELFNHTGVNGLTEDTSGNANRIKVDTGSSTIDHNGNVSNARDNNIANSGNDTTVSNHAYNPSTTPSVGAFDPLNYINEQTADKVTKGTKSEQIEHNVTTYDNSDTTTNNLAAQEASNTSGSRSLNGNDIAHDNRVRKINRGKLAAYEHLIALLDSNVTNEFISKFKYCFKQFIAPEKPLLYMSEDLEAQED